MNFFSKTPQTHISTQKRIYKVCASFCSPKNLDIYNKKWQEISFTVSVAFNVESLFCLVLVFLTESFSFRVSESMQVFAWLHNPIRNSSVLGS